MKTFEECCKEVAIKYHVGEKGLVTGHKFSYFREAAILFAIEKLRHAGKIKFEGETNLLIQNMLEIDNLEKQIKQL